jgi:hypothetical protein
MKDKIKFITEKCIAANPEIRKHYAMCPGCGSGICKQLMYCPIEISRPVRLADVLLAMEEKRGIDEDYMLSPSGNMFAMHTPNGSCIFNWNLRADRLEDQSEETIDFLANLLS